MTAVSLFDQAIKSCKIETLVSANVLPLCMTKKLQILYVLAVSVTSKDQFIQYVLISKMNAPGVLCFNINLSTVFFVFCCCCFCCYTLSSEYMKIVGIFHLLTLCEWGHNINIFLGFVILHCNYNLTLYFHRLILLHTTTETKWCLLHEWSQFFTR